LEREPVVFKMSDKSESDYLIKLPTSRNAKWLEREPVVFLFGWAGCKNRYLDKYVQLYNLQGCATYQFTAPNDILFWHQDRLQGLVETMAEEFIESGYAEHPILFHVFSNGGCAVLTRFMEFFRKRELQQAASSSSNNGRINLRGLVFDSAPARGDYWTRAQAFTEAAFGNYRSLVKMLLVGAFSVVFTFYNWYHSALRWLRGQPSLASTHPYTTLSKMDLRCPMLFIYSKADAICKYQFIEAFMEKQRRRGVQVTKVRFNDSTHCQHGRTYPNEYNEAVKTFLYETVGTTQASTKSRTKSGDADNGDDFVEVGDNGNDADDFEIADKE